MHLCPEHVLLLEFYFGVPPPPPPALQFSRQALAVAIAAGAALRSDRCLFPATLSRRRFWAACLLRRRPQFAHCANSGELHLAVGRAYAARRVGAPEANANRRKRHRFPRRRQRRPSTASAATHRGARVAEAEERASREPRAAQHAAREHEKDRGRHALPICDMRQRNNTSTPRFVHCCSPLRRSLCVVA